MKSKKIMLILITTIFLASIAGVCASDANDTMVAGDDTGKIELSHENEMSADNLQTGKENDELALADNDESVSAQTDTGVLSVDNSTYSKLSEEINQSGNVKLAYKNYVYDNGDPISITEDNKVIDGNGAVIDVAGSNIRAFDVIGNGVTIKNLTIKNVNFWEKGGAIKFAGDSGTVINCNFINNTAQNGGAIYFDSDGNVTNCNFTGNKATENGGAIWMRSGSVENCNFTDNKATGTDSWGGAVYFNLEGTVTNCNFTDNTATYGGAVYFDSYGNVTNCNFTNNTASSQGGAVYFDSYGSVTNCNFTNNTASSQGGAIWSSHTCNVTDCNFTNNQATIYDGGAIVISSGTVSNCNFTNNSATGYGGAINMVFAIVENCNFTDNSANSGGAIRINSGSVSNCNFTNNQATIYDGGAIWLAGAGNVTNCNFTNNTATRYGGAIYSINKYSAADTCIFKDDSDSTYQVRILPPILGVDNFTAFYGSGEKVTFNLTTNSSIPVSNGIISISVYFKNNTNVRNYTCLSGEGWAISLPVGSYYAIFDTEYAKFQPINRTITITIPNVRYYINVTSITTNNKTVNITAKSDIPKNILWDGKLLFILPNGENITANYTGNGTWWAVHRFDDYADYQIHASYIGLDNVTINNATITVSKVNTVLTADAVTATYNINRYFVITLKDANGNALSGAKLTVDLNGAREYVTDANGQVKVNVVKLVPKTYTAIITFNGDDAYAKSTKNVQVTVKKAKAKIVAKKKTFKKAKKVKKYTATLKNNVGNAMKKVKLTLKVKGKTYKAKTNKKGKAVFKIKNLKKKGKYRATVRFAGNNYYSKVTKKVKITVK